jgi:hypothetical protein
MINFFFKGGYRELGCEFLHKSFREYLFAEGVVEILKRYAVDHPELQQERTRDLYWKDFEELDPRYQLTTDLMEALTAQWITPEVDRHIDALIDWEIARAAGNEEPSPGTATERLSLAQWELIRDTLADLWDWWGEGVHLRPQPRMVNDKQTFARSRIDELVAWSAPPPKRGALHSRPPRTATLDAHLGDALFRLNAITHARIAFSTGWSAFKRTALEMWAGVQVRGHVCRRYQTRIVERHRAWVFFAPSGPDPLYFQFYSSRIDGAGYRPGGPFPLGAMCWVLDLRSVYLRIPDHTYSRQVASWRYSNLSGADAAGSAFVGHELISVLARVANFTRCTFDSAVLDWSDFAGARLSSCTFRDASVHELNLRDASIEKSQLLNARRTDNVVLDP